MVEKLNHFLADLVVEYHKLQNFHWYVKGPDFFTVHAKLEEYYDYISDAVDEVAEKILMIQASRSPRCRNSARMRRSRKQRPTM